MDIIIRHAHAPCATGRKKSKFSQNEWNHSHKENKRRCETDTHRRPCHWRIHNQWMKTFPKGQMSTAYITPHFNRFSKYIHAIFDPMLSKHKEKKSEEWITKSSELEWKYSIEFITSASLSTPMVLIGSIRCFGGFYPCIDVNHTVRSYIEIQCTNNDESMRFSLSWAWAQNTSLSECPAVGPAARDSELS